MTLQKLWESTTSDNAFMRRNHDRYTTTFKIPAGNNVEEDGQSFFKLIEISDLALQDLGVEEALHRSGVDVPSYVYNPVDNYLSNLMIYGAKAASPSLSSSHMTKKSKWDKDYNEAIAYLNELCPGKDYVN